MFVVSLILLSIDDRVFAKCCPWVTIIPLLSLPAPVVSDALPINLPCTASDAPTTIAGLNFGAVDVTPTASMTGAGAITCATTSWSSNTVVVCDGRPGELAAVTVDGQIGTRTTGFTFDGKKTFFVSRV